MITKHLCQPTRLLLVVVALLSIHCGSDAEDQTDEEETGDVAVIKIGMRAAELDKIISEYKCEEALVGIKVGYPSGFLDEHDVSNRWIIIPGNTCLRVDLSRLKSEQVFRIDSMVKGPIGKGYPGKLQWRNFELEEVDEVPLKK